MADVVTAAVQQASGRNQVTQQQERDTAGDHGIEGSIGNQVKASQHGHPERREQVCVQRNTELGVHSGQVLGKGQAVVSGERPAQAGLPSVTGDGTAAGGQENKKTEAEGASFVAQGLEIDVQDGHSRTVVNDVAQVVDGKKHGDGVGERSHETNGHRAQDGNGDVGGRGVGFLGQVGGRVQAGKTPVGVDQTDDECNASGRPPGGIIKLDKHKVGALVVAARAHQHRDGDNDVGEKRGVQGAIGDGGEGLSVAVEQDQKQVDELVDDEKLPLLGDVVRVLEHPECHDFIGNTERHGRRGEERPGPRKRATKVSQETRVLARRQHPGPHVLSASQGNGRAHFRQGNANTVGNKCDDDDTVDDEHGTSGLDSGDQRRGDTKPRVGEPEPDAENGPHGKSPLELALAGRGNDGDAFFEALVQLGLERHGSGVSVRQCTGIGSVGSSLG